jgi:hypothetical protein
MDRHQRITRFAAFSALLTALAVSALFPALAPGQDRGDDLLQMLGLKGGGEAPAPEATAGRSDEPQPNGLHRARHRRGGEARDRAADNGSRVATGNPSPSGGSSGTSRGEVAGGIPGQSSGYDAEGAPGGQTGVLSLFGLDAIPPVDDGSDGTEPGLLGQVQRNLLDAVCSGSGGQLCLTVIAPPPVGSEPAGTGSGSASAVPRTALNAFRTASGRDGAADQLLESGAPGRPGAATGSPSGDSRAPLGATGSLPCEPASDAGFAAFTPLRSFVCSPATLAAGRIPAESTSDSTHWLGDVRGLALFAFEILAGVVILLIPLIIERRRRPAY